MNTDEKAMEAWKTFVATGVVPEGYVRPEIEASWRRCKAAGLNPWESDFEECNVVLLREKAKLFKGSIDAVNPVAQMVMALLDCNVSLMDGENFVFYLITPYGSYPRTIGTFIHESRLGTGNATLVAYERKPVRCDGFEHYRVVSQGYSGVSVPYLDRTGKYLGAMNLNSALQPLADSALDIGQVAVEMSQQIFLANKRGVDLLTSAAFFKPLLLLCQAPVAVLDEEGNLLLTSASFDKFAPGWEDAPYGTRNIAEYLAPGVDTNALLDVSHDLSDPIPLVFKRPRSKTSHTTSLRRRSLVNLGNGDAYVVLVFTPDENEDTAHKAGRSKTIKRRSSDTNSSSENTIDYVGDSPEWREVDDIVSRIAPIKANVLLLGETGTGKDMVARAIHRRSGLKGEFVSINGGALPRDLLATELCGYEKGAFTGANEDGALGKFEYADGGTLFLDEIGDMPLDMQVSLLRFLQDRKITRLGSNVSRDVNVRVIAATNKDLQQLIKENKFRSDLYFRLSLIEINLPPLRARKGDVALLSEYFNRDVASLLDFPYSPFPADVIEAFESYSWPGNVRELRNMVERCLIIAGEGSKVTPNLLAPHYRHGASFTGESAGFMTYSVPRAYRGDQSDASADRIVMRSTYADGLSKEEIAEVLRRNEGNILLSAKELNMRGENLLERMEEVGFRLYTSFD